MGRAVLWRDEIPNCVHPDITLIRARLEKDLAYPEYVLAVINSWHMAKAYFRSRAKRTTIASRLSYLGDISRFPLPLPTLSDGEIVE